MIERGRLLGVAGAWWHRGFLAGAIEFEASCFSVHRVRIGDVGTRHVIAKLGGGWGSGFWVRFHQGCSESRTAIRATKE